MLTEIKRKHCCYFVDDQGRKQGEYKYWWDKYRLHTQSFYVDGVYHGEYKEYYENGQLRRHFFYDYGKFHGEYKSWKVSGCLRIHCFYVNDAQISFSEIPMPPYPTTPEDRMYFMLKYNLQLLPVETVC